MNVHADRSVASCRPFQVVLRAAMVVAALLAAPFAGAQPTAPANGPRRIDPAWHALMHADVVTKPGTTIENATIVMRDGVIVSIEPGASAPAGARTWDYTGLTIYPGLIEPFMLVDAPAPDRKSSGAHWNEKVMAQRSALDGEGLNAEARGKLRAMGYVAAAIVPKGGLFMGRSAVVSLAEPGASSDPLASVLKPDAYHAASFENDRLSERDYPSSLMGAIALIRQTLSDAPWYQRAKAAHASSPVEHARPEPNDAVEALAMPLPIWFNVENELNALRAAKIAREFDRRAVLVGSGTEFRRLSPLAAAGMPMVLPLAFAEKPEVATLADRESVDLRQLMTWEASPTNPARVASAGIMAALTTSKLPKGQDFHDNLREAIRAGLSEERALAMLTSAPAEILGLPAMGTLAPGMRASLVVVKGSLFEKERQIRDVWIEGVRHEVKPAPRAELEGAWAATFRITKTGASASEFAGTIKVEKGGALTFERPANDADRAADEKMKAEKQADPQGKPEDAATAPAEAPAGSKEKSDTRSFKARHVTLDENRVDFVLDGEAFNLDGVVLLSGVVEAQAMGSGSAAGVDAINWTASRSDSEKKEEKKEEDAERYAGLPASFGIPFGPYALDALPDQKTVWINNATIWTSGPEGIIEGGTLHVSGGKILGVYKSGAAPKIELPADAIVIDAKGRHVTPGLIDCHSHTGISGGVNEGTQSCTAEVRIFDVIDPDAIGWYRELAGGLTAVNQLHGSANAIGGQNSVVKIRWGVAHPDEMRIAGAPGGIKFALGENVKQSNWGERFTTRYPQTRMGVETFIRDRFTAAREYSKDMAQWSSSPESARAARPGPRRDLELEALAEILAGDRLVHCHSYRQDEILMLCRVAGDFGFRIGTFQHVLEGYKVADAIREHAIGGSAFSDWWAYKWEVIDAIPYAGSIMHDAGVVVSFNSDSDELARRMNIEAAKAVKYGGVDRAEALKFVTINPAKQLKIDHLTGSLEAGKDADFVLWSGDPLSTFTRCEATFVDGRRLFSLEEDAAQRDALNTNRERIIQKLLKKSADSEGGKSGKGDAAAPKPKSAEMVDEPPTFDLLTSGRGAGLAPVGLSIEDARDLAAKRALERHYDWLITNGLDPMSNHGGDCGCAATCLFMMN